MTTTDQTGTDQTGTGLAATGTWRRRIWRLWTAVVLLVVLGGTLYAVQRQHSPTWPVPHADASVAGTPVTVGTDVCGTGWAGGDAGRTTFALWNDSVDGMEVYLRDVATQKVYLDVENLGAGATRSASVTLGPGRYAFRCLPDDADPVTGTARTVAGVAPSAVTPGLVPISSADLIPPTQQYEAWVEHRLPALRQQVTRLAADLRAGERATAKQDWLAAHGTYETLGAAYDAFGDYDAAINGDGRGFHRLESQLWGDGGASAEQRTAARLVDAVDRLQRAFPRLAAQLGTQAIGLRSHEILENAIQFELTGATDAGSHTELATVDANLTGTLAALKPLGPLLARRDPGLAATRTWIARSRRLVRSYHTAAGWKPLDALSRPQRERLDATLEQTVEYLSQVAVITEPRRTDQ